MRRLTSLVLVLVLVLAVNAVAVAEVLGLSLPIVPKNTDYWRCPEGADAPGFMNDEMVELNTEAGRLIGDSQQMAVVLPVGSVLQLYRPVRGVGGVRAMLPAKDGAVEIRVAINDVEASWLPDSWNEYGLQWVYTAKPVLVTYLDASMFSERVPIIDPYYNKEGDRFVPLKVESL